MEPEEVTEKESMNLADGMMICGVHLRKLRELADLDERAREESNVAAEHVHGRCEPPQEDRDIILPLDNGKCILRYESYLSHQSYFDDLKHYDCDYIDYNGLVIQQDKSKGKGGLCWDAAFVLAEHLISGGIHISPDDAIVELGAGTGLCGLLLASNVPCHVEITDLQSLLPLMRRNISLNYECVNDLSPADRAIIFGSETVARMGTCEARILEWGPQSQMQKKYSIILGADVVASLYDPVALADTIHQLSMPDTIVCISYKRRLDGPHERFEHRLQQLYRDVRTRISPSSRNKNPGVFILQATGKFI